MSTHRGEKARGEKGGVSLAFPAGAYTSEYTQSKTAAFGRTFYHDGKISQTGEGEGCIRTVGILKSYMKGKLS
jgi:hypothetical protein